MEKNRAIELTGVLKWVRPNKADDWGNWSMTLYPDKPSLEIVEKFKALGLKNEIHKDDDGYFIRIRRPVQKMMKGKLTSFTPPQVFDQQGQPWNPQLSIGNGSSGTVKIFIYFFKIPGSGKEGCAARWEALKVKDYVPFEGNTNGDFTQQEAKGHKGL